MTDIQRLDTFLHELRDVIFNPNCLSAPTLRNLKLKLMEALADFNKSEQSIRTKVEDYDQVKQKASERLIEIQGLQTLLRKTDDLGSISRVRQDPNDVSI